VILSSVKVFQPSWDSLNSAREMTNDVMRSESRVSGAAIETVE